MPHRLSLATVVRRFAASLVGFLHRTFQPLLDQVCNTRRSTTATCQLISAVQHAGCSRSSPTRSASTTSRVICETARSSTSTTACWALRPDGRHTAPGEDRLRRSAPAPASLLSCTPDLTRVEMPKRPELAVGLGDKHPSDRVRLISLLSERKRQFT